VNIIVFVVNSAAMGLNVYVAARLFPSWEGIISATAAGVGLGVIFWSLAMEVRLSSMRSL
jgi:hypothetical protein